MIFALIKNGLVDNTVICDSEKIANDLYSDSYLVVNIDGLSVGVGWTYDGTTFIEPEFAKTPEEISAENMMHASSEYENASSVIDEINDQLEDEDYTGTTESALRDELSAWTDYRKKLRAYIKADDGSQELPKSPAAGV